MLDIKPEAEVIYDPERWRVLARKRKRAIEVMEVLYSRGTPAYVYGSVARGDVRESSDVDVVVPRYSLPPSLLEGILADHLGDPVYREIVQATPRSTPKYHIHFNGNTTVSIPIGILRKREEEFYKFGGRLNLMGLRRGKRVPGVNKELRLIFPTENGHLEYPVLGYEEYVARVLGVDKDVVEERVRILTKRKSVGTTGLYLKYHLLPRESFEEAISKLKKVKKGFRSRLAEDRI
ncbi:MAG: nucleotidyltransferase domain-containing protein [Candidatus Korarchaeota archaeon]|nr:nucleotidyltransferase domain-containing protein [Candidatus Korarchaeota archaeon]